MEVMLNVVKKLPAFLRDEWVERSSVIECETGKRANFAALAEFVAEQNQTANSIFGRALHKSTNFRRPTSSRRSSAAAQSEEQPKKTATRCLQCLCWSNQHDIMKCRKFAGMNCRDRYQCARARGLCCRCPSSGHMVKDCVEKTGCTVDGCEKSHHVLLHFPRELDARNEPSAVFHRTQLRRLEIKRRFI